MLERFINKGGRQERSSLGNLQVGEILYFSKPPNKLRMPIYYQERKYAKEFEYEIIKNGTLIKRTK